MTIKGTIEEIECFDDAGHAKRVLTIKPTHRQCAFVEFRGRLISSVKKFKEGDTIEVDLELQGKKSLNTGIMYNNLVALPGARKIL